MSVPVTVQPAMAVDPVVRVPVAGPVSKLPLSKSVAAIAVPERTTAATRAPVTLSISMGAPVW